MIVILTTEDDHSTCEVIDWLIAYNKPYIRVNENDLIDVHWVSGADQGFDFVLKFSDQVIRLSEIKSFWFRRGWLHIGPMPLTSTSGFSPELNRQILRHLQKEQIELQDFLGHLLATKHALGHPVQDQVNKMINLWQAQSVGIKIPSFTITQQAQQVQNALQTQPLITKGIQGVANFEADGEMYGNYTESVDQTAIDQWGRTFFPSLFQEKLDKMYELRIFYLKGKFYPMAIFSQNDPQTSVDFRRYNEKCPNRVVPYLLPQSLEQRLEKLMQMIPLSTGSIDMVYTKANEYVFLEVNPIGQFGMVSHPCNYQLEQAIAQFLSEPFLYENQ
ncbi:grasp-with-spasm system ATP-grasp peptide maturase [marine bacterium AO1-C]|nr:grasp-with-spasm system ATP-grasp peptide maturase [marine bacterium AO1-C]